jgi:hypothetical protein
VLGYRMPSPHFRERYIGCSIAYSDQLTAVPARNDPHPTRPALTGCGIDCNRHVDGRPGDPYLAGQLEHPGTQLTFLSADANLNTAALAELLSVDDPNSHPNPLQTAEANGLQSILHAGNSVTIS